MSTGLKLEEDKLKSLLEMKDHDGFQLLLKEKIEPLLQEAYNDLLLKPIPCANGVQALIHIAEVRGLIRGLSTLKAVLDGEIELAEENLKTIREIINTTQSETQEKNPDDFAQGGYQI